MTMLKWALLGDAAACAASGLLLAGVAGVLAAPLGLPEALLRGAGFFLLPWAGFVALVGRSTQPSRGAVLAIIAVNALWVLDSLLLAGGAFGFVPSHLGQACVMAQAAMAAGFTALQVLALPARQVPA
ncbi:MULTISPECIES: hypothetical protein [Roseomonadaceae]|uniref:Uncharacterized protein n=1 Tax=Falsiroseomonas oleicola TaxID=2801474 RepID=A0ABS6H9Y6_9PROT|nr:hypothetical protein [Roseomonas oleicola]MBU8545249.1 hypothetical protein [Roseomonas oleicola]